MSISRWWGPVFDAERTTRARRWQGYAMRSLFVLALLVGLILVWTNQNRRNGVITVEEMAQMGGAAYSVVTLLAITTVLLIAPAATAGAICRMSRGSNGFGMMYSGPNTGAAPP